MGDNVDFSVEASERIEKSLAKTLGFRVFVENEDGVFIPV